VKDSFYLSPKRLQTNPQGYWYRKQRQVNDCISVEDVLMRADRIMGLVILWSAVAMAGLMS